MRRTFILTAIPAMLLIVTQLTCTAQRPGKVQLAQIPYPDLSVLTQEDRSVFGRIANHQFCYCGCEHTLARCLELRPDCPKAKRMADFVMRHIQDGLYEGEIHEALASGFVGAYLSEPRTIPMDEAPSMGRADAPVTIVEFADFKCPHCRATSPLLAEILERHPDDVRVVFKYFPLSGHPGAVNVAIFAEAAHQQGKFREMHDALFSDDPPSHQESAVGTASSIGLDIGHYREALNDPELRERVLRSKQDGTDLGVISLPTLFINGRPFGLDRTVANLLDRVEMEMERTVVSCH